MKLTLLFVTILWLLFAGSASAGNCVWTGGCSMETSCGDTSSCASCHGPAQSAWDCGSGWHCSPLQCVNRSAPDIRELPSLVKPPHGWKGLTTEGAESQRTAEMLTAVYRALLPRSDFKPSSLIAAHRVPEFRAAVAKRERLGFVQIDQGKY